MLFDPQLLWITKDGTMITQHFCVTLVTQRLFWVDSSQFQEWDWSCTTLNVHSIQVFEHDLQIVWYGFAGHNYRKKK